MARRKENDAIFRLKSKHSCHYWMFGKYLAHCRIGLAWQVNRTNIPGYSMYFYSRTRSVKRTVNLNSWPAVSRPICFAGVYWFLTAFRLRSGFCNKKSLPVVARACIVVFSAFRVSWSSFWEDDDFSFYKQHPWIGVVSCGLHWFGVLGGSHPWEWLPLLLRRRCITLCSRYDLKKPVVLIPQRMQESLTAERVRSGVPFVSQS